MWWHDYRGEFQGEAGDTITDERTIKKTRPCTTARVIFSDTEVTKNHDSAGKCLGWPSRRRSSWHEAWRSGLGSRGESGNDKRGPRLRQPTSRPSRTEGPEGKRSPREMHDSVQGKPDFRAKEVKTLLTRLEHRGVCWWCALQGSVEGFGGGIGGGPEP